MPAFELQSKYAPTGDQPTAIRQLTDGLKKGIREQTLLGVTGSGKTFTMANIIQKDLLKPVLKQEGQRNLPGSLLTWKPFRNRINQWASQVIMIFH